MATAPGKSFRKGLTILELTDMFPTEESAREWFEGIIWAKGRHCPHCGSCNTVENGGRSEARPYHCKDCHQHFSVRLGTILEGSPLPFRKWVLAIYLHMTSLKGVSSMKLHRDIGVTQKTAWFMLQRIREAFKRDDDDEPPMGGPVEVDETFVGGRRRNMSNAKRKEAEGRGPVDMTAVVGAKCRTSNTVAAKVVQSTDKPTLQGFIADHAAKDAKVYTDDHGAYSGMPFDHEAVNHSAAEYVRDMAHTNGIESFWAVLKRAHKGVYHKFSVKHLQRYVTDFAGRHNVRTKDTLSQMEHIVAGMVGKRLTYKALKADNGLPSGARS
ncbi:MAG: IS1595 family transposase [Boseongicola sp. SB0675_bin_26]|nr:IS1595 family transposase [Boseongicola sp. SB0675_bin_26]